MELPISTINELAEWLAANGWPHKLFVSGSDYRWLQTHRSGFTYHLPFMIGPTLIVPRTAEAMDVSGQKVFRTE